MTTGSGYNAGMSLAKLKTEMIEGLGVGVTRVGDQLSSTLKAEIGSTGVVYIEGNLSIDENNLVAAGESLLLLVNGTVTIEPAVSSFDGLVVAQGSISTSGQSASQLEVNGVLVSVGGNVSLTRSFVDMAVNNTAPASVVNYRPDMIFVLDNRLMKLLSGWREIW